jgi:casein kinase I family protein HRR25
MAMKIEAESDDSGLLEREIKVLMELRKKTGFP